MKKLKSLSLFFPVYNDEKIIPYIVCRADSVAQSLTDDYEIILVNDGSTDDTKTILSQLQKRYPHLRVITHTHNQGYGAALRTGFSASRKEWIFYTDGDGQYDVMELKSLVQPASPAVDVVNGYKSTRADSIVRKITGWLYNGLCHVVYPLPVADVDCDFRLMRRSVIRKIGLQSSSGTICLELVLKLAQAGARFAQVKVHHYPRLHGSSQFFSPRHLIQFMNENLTFHQNYRRKSVPTK